MSWRNICPMNEKIKFIAAVKECELSMTDLCNRFVISRKTGYKWLDRYDTHGATGLHDKSSARLTQEHRTADSHVKAILHLKTKYKNWGPKKLKVWLERKEPLTIWPAASTIGDILKQHGLVERRKARRRVPPYSQPFAECNAANDSWSADFKGQFLLGNNKYCYPLTITDNFSRYILACDGYLSPNLENVKRSFEHVFANYGLPNSIKTDNGIPFSSTSIGGLSQLAIWWIKLGILPERIEPGHPEQNGRHERMHKTLKHDTASPPQKTLIAQNALFDNFIEEFNYQRPHESINNKTPAEVYSCSKREYRNIMPKIMYDDDYIIRKVRCNGCIKWKGGLVYLTSLLHGEPIGLRETDNGLWEVMFSFLKLGVINEVKSKIIRPSQYKQTN